MQYWINHNGVQSGPMELDALKEMGLTSSAYVWHEGLTDWVKITQLPELQGLYQMLGTPQEMAQTVETGQPVEPGVETASSTVGESSQPASEPSQPVVESTHYGTSQQWQQPQAAGYQVPVQPQTSTEPCPPTNLVWAIITTLLCCLPAGVVAIAYAVKVQNKYREGDIEGAKRASETGAWWCIASIILFILTMPFIWLIQAAMS